MNHVNKIVMSRRTVTQTHNDRSPTMRIDVGRGVPEPVQGVSLSRQYGHPQRTAVSKAQEVRTTSTAAAERTDVRALTTVPQTLKMPKPRATNCEISLLAAIIFI